ncbi:MAG: hypothetical protein KY450_11950, partial [Actinobacteria bacterium]|nr:hypothetical protein [Actinomycetota bacterium]
DLAAGQAMTVAASDRGWFEHLSGDDLRLLSGVASSAGVDPDDVRTHPDALAEVMAHPVTFDSVFAPADGEALALTSPFLTFALIVHRGWAELRTARHIDEWVGPGRRLPVLGGDDIRGCLAGAQRRLFLTELLASYPRVTSGTTWVRTARGWRRRRFSELDPVRLASLLDVVPPAEHPGVYRRLGDLALFLTGVFPDHTEMHGLGPLDEGRLLRISGLDADPQRGAGGRSELPSTGTVSVLERLGKRWYCLASRTTQGPLTGTMPVVAELAERFGVARRTLNFLTDRHVFIHRRDWFGEPAF